MLLLKTIFATENKDSFLFPLVKVRCIINALLALGFAMLSGLYYILRLTN